MPYLPIEWDLVSDARIVDQGAQVSPGTAIGGLLSLWYHIATGQKVVVTPIELAGCFGPNQPRLVDMLVAFHFLAIEPGGNYRVLNPPPLRKWQERKQDRHAPLIYFIRAGAEGPIKIGFTSCLPKRLKVLQTAHAETIRVLITRPGTEADEQALHQRFQHLHVSGEWFRPGADLLAYIQGLN